MDEKPYETKATTRKLLVIGAQDASLGQAVADFGRVRRWEVVTAGVSGQEMVELDLRRAGQPTWDHLFEERGLPHAVVCTAGINEPSYSLTEDRPPDLGRSLLINVEVHMYALWHWLRAWREHPYATAFPLSWVSISSNSASIARSKSMAYCASKAALSMALRCAGRDMAGSPFSIYGYEPGWIDGTPMSEAKEEELAEDSTSPGDTKLHRIPGDRTVSTDDMSAIIINNLDLDRSLNGTLLRVDGGEQ